ncbi:hypothetical protein AB6A40_010019 [Gnathostoma spinigerum]|uniref:Globin n=1 Tax=Gnathostoma spinigerum TaxID=75299 RepID=A0ABD6F2L2_9BILA
MDQAKADIAVRIVQRMAHARDDFAQFCANLTKEQWQDIVDSLKNFLNDVVKNLNSTDKISQISHRFGMHQVPKRNFGFKADFFSLMANALTTECVFLDAAAHQPTEAIEAWAELVGLMFTNVRDGYYEQVRQLRRASQNPCSPSASVGEPTFNENGYTSPKRIVPVRQGNRQRTSVEEG